ncbi:hypothetical protein DL240_16165 [Lujinxingia litoralis]|uniref:Uncharacterized protein n=1 Tax=Lujinxingia litoralis TaxID=2211119 RepID=A0A328C6F4_9DELT|nr:hypothetical protein [Lujinxingia litoralis]RAL20571.1 hypothetical protein DL240_16165 [Lujinxingia litoralis]
MGATLTRVMAMLALTLGLMGCGPDEDAPLCQSDYECAESEVCEPQGCRKSCAEPGDCPTGQRCGLRRVEEGRVCQR